MKSRFEGADGKRLLIEELRKQRLVSGDTQLATEIAHCGELRQVEAGEEIIHEGGADNHIFFILSGSFDTIVRGWRVAQRGAGNTIGEIAAIQASEPRSATVRAIQPSVLCILTESQLNSIGNSYPEIYRRLSQELARRLLEGNNLVSSSGGDIRILIVSSVQGLKIARALESVLEYDPVLVHVWKGGIFLESGYSIDSLERALENADFAIAVASTEEVLRAESQSSDRDNVVFELGFFMGKLGRHRTLLLEPREDHAALPPSLAGICTLPYSNAAPAHLTAALQPTCSQLRGYIRQFGPRN